MVSIAGFGIGLGEIRLVALMFGIVFVLATFAFYWNTDTVPKIISEKIIGSPKCTNGVLGANFCFFPSKEEWDSTTQPIMNIVGALKGGKYDVGIITNFVLLMLSGLNSIWIVFRGIIGLTMVFYLLKMVWAIFMFFFSLSSA
jgi:hypothetical protein